MVTFSLFAQTKVVAKKLGKTLESNKKMDVEFEVDLIFSEFSVNSDGMVTVPLLSTNKVKIVSGMDMTALSQRVEYSKKTSATITLKPQDLSAKMKVYALTKISGIETYEDYSARLAEETRKEAEEAREKAEAERLASFTKLPVQVINLEVVNLDSKEAVWLPGQIQDKLKSSLQEHLGMKTVVDSKSETAVKKLQAESEDYGRDESSAIELGKITTAKFAVFFKLRKTNTGYVISADFTDLTTGEQLVSVTSKEYSAPEYLYGSTGAVDEITLAIGNGLNLVMSDITKNLLTLGSANFSVDEQLVLAKQNEAQFRKMMSDYDAELSKLMTSNDINAIQNKNRIEAEKALLVEKQNAEKKRQQELAEQKKRVEEDSKLEAERSIALKTQRDQMAKDAAEKAAEVRKLKMEKQGVLGQINVIESKKKALVEIRQGVESRQQELYDQLVKDRESEEQRIRNKSWSTVELENDKPTEAAKQRREKQVVKRYEDLTNKFFTEAEAVKQSTMSQQNTLLAEIRSDQKALTATRTVSSMGDELKVSYGTYAGSQNGWNAYLSLYSDGILLYTDDFIVNYEAVSGNKAPDMATELDDSKIEEYVNNVDMYNSLLTRGDPIIYFEIDYNVTAEGDDKPSEYNFNFTKIRVINTVSGKVTQTSTLNKVQPRTMKPEWDLREIVGIVAKEKEYFDALTEYTSNGYVLNEAKKVAYGLKMVDIPSKSFYILTTEVTQKTYESIMGSNPSYFKGNNNPVENVSWYDAIYFCNKLSERLGFAPVYFVDGKTDVTTWDYTPHKGNSIKGEITQNLNANGFRLPTEDEWEYAAKGGQNFIFAGSNNLDEVGWYESNSEGKTHPVAQKKANGYGLYDMSGNVWEWCWDSRDSNYRYCRGCGSHSLTGRWCTLDYRNSEEVSGQYGYVGFRIVCSYSFLEIKMMDISGGDFKMLSTEVPQKLYTLIMGSNPSNFKGDNNPVEEVSLYDAIYFCNKFSGKIGFTPVYSVDGKTDVTTWDYTPHKGYSIKGEITQNLNANGFRLPTVKEWEYAAKGGQDYRYSGSNNLDEVGWYTGNSGDTTHLIALKKSNGYGLYDMSGNVSEWCWNAYYSYFRYYCGGSYNRDDEYCKVGYRDYSFADRRCRDLGFRIVRSAPN